MCSSACWRQQALILLGSWSCHTIVCIAALGRVPLLMRSGIVMQSCGLSSPGACTAISGSCSLSSGLLVMLKLHVALLAIVAVAGPACFYNFQWRLPHAHPHGLSKPAASAAADDGSIKPQCIQHHAWRGARNNLCPKN
jgi:hypothetical protein